MKNKYDINMEFLKVSRKKPAVGDIFTFKNKYLGWGYGLVVKIGPVRWLNDMLRYSSEKEREDYAEDFLVYIYNHFTKELEKDPILDKNHLAIDPIIINRRGWLDGFFQNIKHIPLTENDILKNHCFIDLPVRGEYEFVDETGKKIDKRIEPCGTYGISTHRKIDDLLSEKYNLPFAKLSKEEEEIIKKRGETWPQKIKWW